jgi:8-oxo-dGTP diphosphatase
MSQPIGCIVLIIRGNKILLGKRRNGYAPGTFGVPGGRVEPGEKLVDCAARELKEETGLVSANFDYVGAVKEFQDDYDFVHFVFKCEEFVGEPENVEPEKCEGWVWYDLNKLPSPLIAGSRWGIDMLISSESTLRDV